MSTKTTDTTAKIAIPTTDTKAETAAPQAPKELQKLQPLSTPTKKFNFSSKKGLGSVKRFGAWLGKEIDKIFLLALIVYFVAHMCPSFQEDFPAIYRLFTGILDIFDVVWEFLLNLLAKLFGNLGIG